MPLDPRTWKTNDIVSAARLNADLNSFRAEQFSPTGVRFHARRPLYKATQSCTTDPWSGDSTSGGISVAAGAWRGIFEDFGSNVIVDSSGDYGAHMDPGYSGTIRDALTYSNGNPSLPFGSSGNAIGGGGGWYLVSAFTPIGGNAGSHCRANLANGWKGTTPNFISTGTNQNGNNGHDSCPFVIDLIDFDGGAYTPVVQNGDSVSHNVKTNVDGSGETCYFTAQWASVNPQYGFQSSLAPNPRSSWGINSTVTSSLLNGNQGIRDVLRVLNMPPALRQTTGSSVNVPNNNETTVVMGTPNSTLDSYNGWSGSPNYQYTVPMDGLYFVYGIVSFQTASVNVPARAGIKINTKATYWGPYSNMPAGSDSAVAKMQIMDLHAGDTVQLHTMQQSGQTVGTSTGYPPILLVLWLGNLGIPSPLPSVPDLSYRYAAGDQNAMGTFNAHLANDLNFLTSKPYVTAYQTVAQAVPQSSDTKITMDTVSGMVHAANGDNYSGWDSVANRYVAQRSGWYMAVAEYFFPNSTFNANCSTVAEFHCSTSSNTQSSSDWYQHQNLPTSATNSPGGAAALGYYYLRAGDYLVPYCQTQDTASGTFSTFIGSNNSSHFECVWVSE